MLRRGNSEGTIPLLIRGTVPLVIIFFFSLLRVLSSIWVFVPVLGMPSRRSKDVC